MNPDLLADGRADFRFDAFNEAHANNSYQVLANRVLKNVFWDIFYAKTQ